MMKAVVRVATARRRRRMVDVWDFIVDARYWEQPGGVVVVFDR